MIDLVDYIARSLVEHPDEVSVEEIRQGGKVILRLHVADEDMGRVIGREGRVANAMRVLMRMMASRTGQRVQLDIE